MSLDVCLISEPTESKKICPECGNEYSRINREVLFDQNITHNLNKMAEAVGIYKCLWRPDENGYTRARQLIKPLTAGLKKLRSNPDKFKELDAENGWGTYDVFVPWIEKYLNACVKYPNAIIEVSR